VVRSFSATVRQGVIVPDDVDLPEGAVVTIVVDDDAEYVPTPEELVELDAALAEAEGAEGLPAAELLAQLRQMP
jgi:hypothetical protein